MVTNEATDRQIANEIEKDMCVVYRIVGICLNIPQPTFKWYDQSGKTHSYQTITLLEFHETVARPTFNVDDKIHFRRFRTYVAVVVSPDIAIVSRPSASVELSMKSNVHTTVCFIFFLFRLFTRSFKSLSALDKIVG